jgi:CBS domain-containing protein
MFTRRGVATAGEGTPAAEALRLLDAQGFGPVLVLNQAGVVMGAAYRDRLASAMADAKAESVMRFGMSTVRPSEDAAALAHRMGGKEVSRVVVTRPDGTLAGLFFAADLPAQLACPEDVGEHPLVAARGQVGRIAQGQQEGAGMPGRPLLAGLPAGEEVHEGTASCGWRRAVRIQ